jgi:hypothetical protein
MGGGEGERGVKAAHWVGLVKVGPTVKDVGLIQQVLACLLHDRITRVTHEETDSRRWRPR